MNWREELKRWRVVSDLIQKEAADSLGVPFDTFRAWEAGRYEPPSYTKKSIREKIHADTSAKSSNR